MSNQRSYSKDRLPMMRMISCRFVCPLEWNINSEHLCIMQPLIFNKHFEQSSTKLNKFLIVQSWSVKGATWPRFRRKQWFYTLLGNLAYWSWANTRWHIERQRMSQQNECSRKGRCNLRNITYPTIQWVTMRRKLPYELGPRQFYRRL